MSAERRVCDHNCIPCRGGLLEFFRAGWVWADGRARPNWRQATKTHCIRGHAFDEANTLNSDGRRRCRTCARERQR